MIKLILLALIVSSFFSIKANAQTAAASDPVLIELFTSQGCSSCPPAEALLDRWGTDLFNANKALPLAFHVDYWDYLGWKDPFSSPEASDRQRAYGAFFQSNSIYTPQMVIQGQVGFNGADSARAQRELLEAHTSSLPALGLSTHYGFNTLETRVTIPNTLAQNLNKDSILYVAVFENNLSTSVQKGENSGAVLNESFVVRNLKAVNYGNIQGSEERLVLPQIPGTKASHLGIAVWFQDRQTMKVIGLKWVYPLMKAL
jgi:hypothetical protein